VKTIVYVVICIKFIESGQKLSENWFTISDQ